MLSQESIGTPSFKCNIKYQQSFNERNMVDSSNSDLKEGVSIIKDIELVNSFLPTNEFLRHFDESVDKIFPAVTCQEILWHPKNEDGKQRNLDSPMRRNQSLANEGNTQKMKRKPKDCKQGPIRNINYEKLQLILRRTKQMGKCIENHRQEVKIMKDQFEQKLRQILLFMNSRNLNKPTKVQEKKEKVKELKEAHQQISNLDRQIWQLRSENQRLRSQIEANNSKNNLTNSSHLSSVDNCHKFFDKINKLEDEIHKMKRNENQMKESITRQLKLQVNGQLEQIQKDRQQFQNREKEIIIKEAELKIREEFLHKEQTIRKRYQSLGERWSPQLSSRNNDSDKERDLQYSIKPLCKKISFDSNPEDRRSKTEISLNQLSQRKNELERKIKYKQKQREVYEKRLGVKTNPLMTNTIRYFRDHNNIELSCRLERISSSIEKELSFLS